MATTFKLGLCEGRHNIKGVDTYIFKDGDIQFPINTTALQNKVIDRFNDLGVSQRDDLIIYVTGLTPALTAVIKVAFKNCMTLTLMHYDTATGNYIADELFSPNHVGYDLEYPHWVCP